MPNRKDFEIRGVAVAAAPATDPKLSKEQLEALVAFLQKTVNADDER